MIKQFLSQKMIKVACLALLGMGLTLSQLQGAVSINISAEKLKDPGGFAMAVEGVLVLAADANGDGFGGAGDTSFTVGDDVMIAKWDIASGGGNAPGAFLGSTGSVSYSGDWGEGDPLAIYWFPTLTSADASPGAAVPYGWYRVIAENLTLSGTLDPMQATTNASNVGTGSGTITGDYNSTTNTLNYSITFQDLTAAVTNMHFHRGAVGVGGGVDLGIGASPWASPQVGSSVILDDSQEANLGTGNWYVNIHTADFGGGEIRGQVLVSGAAGGSNPNGSDDWTSPADGISGHSLIFLTTDDDVLNPGGESPATAGEAMNFTPGDGPAAPSGTAGAVNGLAIDVTWTDNASDETGYRIERSLTGGAWSILGEVAAGTSLYSDDTVEGSTEYVYRVLALRGPSQSGYDISAPVISAAASARFTNLSTRALVQTGDNILIASFRVQGGPLRIYSRAIGPGLLPSGITEFLADPTMELRKISDGSLVASNDNWRVGGQEAEILATIIQPGDDAESALIANLDEEGFYSIVVRGVGDTIGFANVELYEFPDPAEPVSGKLTNLSTRALVQTGNNILIASFQVTGDAPQRIFSRAIGPGLLPSGITEFLADPIMEIRKVLENTLEGGNDGWRTDQEAEIIATTIPPGDDAESAVIATLGENSLYSVVVRGVADTEGFANVEVYDFPE
jgi:hypothetical protein